MDSLNGRDVEHNLNEACSICGRKRGDGWILSVKDYWDRFWCKEYAERDLALITFTITEPDPLS